MRKSRLGVVVSTLVLVVAACGSGGEVSDDAPTGTVDEPEITTSLPPGGESAPSTDTATPVPPSQPDVSGQSRSGPSFPVWGPPTAVQSPPPDPSSTAEEVHSAFWKSSAASSAGLVIVDWTAQGPDFTAATTVWFSPDALVWEPVERIAGVRLRTVMTGGPGFVAVGHEESDTLGLETNAGSLPYPIPAVWTSHDGRTWSAAEEIDSGPFEYGEVRDVAGAGDGLIAVGQVWGADMRSRPAVWTSANGSTWTLAPGDPFDLVLEREDQMFMTLAVGADGYVAVGLTAVAWSSGPGPIVTWWSPDGVVWQRTSSAPKAFPVGASFSGLVGFGSGFVLAGSHVPLGPVVWHSADGRLWDEPIELPTNRETGTSFVHGLGTDGSILVAIGDDVIYDEELGAGGAGLSIWMSSDGAEWVQVPPRALWGSAILDAVHPGSVLSFRSDWIVLGSTHSYPDEVPSGLVWFGSTPSTATTESDDRAGPCDPTWVATAANEAISAARLASPYSRWEQPATNGAFVDRTIDPNRFAQTLGFDCSWSASQHIGTHERLAVAAWTGDRLSLVIQATDHPTEPYRQDETHDLPLDGPIGELVADETWAGTVSTGETIIMLTRNTTNAGVMAKSFLALPVRVPDADFRGETTTERMAISALRAAGGRNVYIGEPSHGSPIVTLMLVSPAGDQLEADIFPETHRDPLGLFTYLNSARPFDDDIHGTLVRLSDLDFAADYITSAAAFTCNGFGWNLVASTGAANETRDFAAELIETLQCT